MALHKTIAPGTLIRVKSLKQNTTGIVGGSGTLEGIRMWIPKGITGHELAATAQLGETLTVIKKPRRVDGINLCLVENCDGIQGDVYWTELRGNCEVV